MSFSSSLIIHEENTKENHKRIVSIFSLNTDSFEKLYKELEVVLYHGLKTPRTHFSVF